MNKKIKIMNINIQNNNFNGITIGIDFGTSGLCFAFFIFNGWKEDS